MRHVETPRLDRRDRFISICSLLAALRGVNIAVRAMSVLGQKERGGTTPARREAPASASTGNRPPGSPAARRTTPASSCCLPGSTGTGSATAPATASPAGAAAADCPGSFPCYTPRQLRAAYGIQPLLDRGMAAASRWRCPRRPNRGRAAPAGLRPPAVGHRHPAGPGGLRPPVRTAPRADPGHHGLGGLVRFAVAGRRGGGGGRRAGARRRPGRHHPRDPGRPGRR